MDPITINLNINLSEQQTEWICGAIGCLAQIIDQASRTAGTPFPPAQVNMTQHGDFGTQIAQVANVSKKAGTAAEAVKRAAESAAKVQQNLENAAEAQQDNTDALDKPEPEAAKHTTEDLRNLAIGLMQIDKATKAKVTEIVHQYAKKVTEIPPEQIDEVYALLSKLKAPEVDDGTDA